MTSLPLPDATTVAVVATGCAATICDLRTRRIPNALTFGSAALAIAFHGADAGGMNEGLTAAAWSAAGWLVGLALFLPVFALRALGGGDVKLLAAFGAWLGPAAVCWVAIYGAIAGGVLALPLLLAKRAVGRTMANLWGLLTFWRAGGIRPHPGLTLESPGALRMPYALPIAVGSVLTLWWRR